jgi:hypothetical protein
VIPTVPLAGVCVGCSRLVRPRQGGTWEEVVGWRRADTRQGALREARATGRVLCAGCLPGDIAGQGELLFDV